MAPADLFGERAGHAVLVANIRESLILDAEGEARKVPHRDAVAALAKGMVPVVCHRKVLAQRLGVRPFRACDLLELFAFVRPAAPCLPTAGGLADALGLAKPKGLSEEAGTLARAAELLLEELDADSDPDAAAIASFMAGAGWPWGAAVLDRLGGADSVPADTAGLRVWSRLPEIAEHPPQFQPGSNPVDPGDARRRLADLLGPSAEDRPGQADFTSALTTAFAPRDRENGPARSDRRKPAPA